MNRQSIGFEYLRVLNIKFSFEEKFPKLIYDH